MLFAISTFEFFDRTGFVYLPGKADEGYKLTVATIFRGVEGNRFYATDAWNRLLIPLISQHQGVVSLGL